MNNRLTMELLSQLNFFSTQKDSLLDTIAQLAAIICDTPIGILSAIQGNTQWVKSGSELIGRDKFHIDHGYCKETLNHNALFEICDTFSTQAHANKTLSIKHPHIRFYAGVPIRTKDNNHVGTLCVMDVVPRKLSDSNAALLIGLAETISQTLNERLGTTNQIIQSKHALYTSLDSLNEAVFSLNKNNIIEAINTHAEKLSGSTLTKGMQIDISDHQDGSLIEIANNLAEPHSIHPTRHVFKDQFQGALGSVVVLRELISKEGSAFNKDDAYTHDGLTGVMNRAMFETLLERSRLDAFEHSRAHAAIYLDIDQFKIINDSFGQTIGNQLLKEIVNELHACVRNSDTIARLGGDEFGILLESCGGKESAMRVAQTIANRIENFRLDANTQRISISVSIGLVIIDDHWPNVVSIMQAGEHACEAAKESGKNNIHLYFDRDSIIETRRGEMQWAARLTHAIEENQFTLFCQRITPLNQETGGHGEVLLRLKDGKGGFISPSEFLPAAERYHLASRIDRWVVAEVFKWMQSHYDQLDHMETISVNLSGQSISDRKFQVYVLDLISYLKLDCHKLCFEITETAAITSLSEANVFIEALRAHQVRFSLDDFGSGVSSFSYLKHLSVDYLKIDGQFIQDLKNNKIDQATVRCISEVAKVTGKKTIAEWVEDESVESMLREIGIDYTQGFLRHKPAPIHFMLDTKCTYQH